MLRAAIGRLLKLAGPWAAFIGAITAAVLFALMPVIKVTTAHVDENALIAGFTTPMYSWPPTPGAVGRLGLQALGDECFAEFRIRGTFADGDAFYVVVNTERQASVETAAVLADAWIERRRSLTATAVFLSARNWSCAEAHLAKHVDPAYRIKGAVLLNHASHRRNDLCVEFMSDFGSQPNHDFLLIGLLHGGGPMVCPKQPSKAMEGVIDAATRIALLVTGNRLERNVAVSYFTQLRELILGFTVRSDVSPSRSMLSTFHLGAGGYPPAFEITDVHGDVKTQPPSASGSSAAADITDVTLWAMNNINERLHHSFAVWYPITAHHFVENNAAQLQGLVVVGGILAAAYFNWIAVQGYALEADCLASDGAFVLGAVLMPLTMQGSVGSFSLGVWAAFGAAWAALYTLCRKVAFSETAWAKSRSAVTPLALVLLGCAIFCLSAVAPAVSNVLGVAVGLSSIYVPGTHALVKFARSACRVVCIPFSVLLVAAFFADSESSWVAACASVTVFAALVER